VRDAVCEAVVGFDLSKFGIDAAAKRVKRARAENLFFAVAGIYDMPLQDACADAVVSIFAPCAEQEFARVLKSGGVVIAVGAGEEHLLGLKRAVYDEVYKNAPREDMPQSMKLLEETRVSFLASIAGNDAIRDLFSMTPYYYRTSEADLAKLFKLDRLETEIDVTVSVYQKV
jgi:23S rRNA (guanine745-N1)-methyltransferase